MDDYGKPYVLAIAEGSDYYIPDAVHIERNDGLMLVETDEQAARCAEQDGVKLVYSMEDVPDGVYVDTPENRTAILRGLEQYPEYRHVGTKEHGSEQGESASGFGMTLGKG